MAKFYTELNVPGIGHVVVHHPSYTLFSVDQQLNPMCRPSPLDLKRPFDVGSRGRLCTCRRHRMAMVCRRRELIDGIEYVAEMYFVDVNDVRELTFEYDNFILPATPISELYRSLR